MQKYFVPKNQLLEKTAVLSGDDAHHAIRVMRMEIGDQFVCSNGVDREAVVRVTEIDKSTVTAEIVEELSATMESKVEVWIAQSLPKGDKLETVIQRCTEIGASRFIPFTSSRTIVQYDAKKEVKRAERWNKIAKEAAEQAHRQRIPVIEAPMTWGSMLKLAEEADAALFCYEKNDSLNFRQIIAHTLGRQKQEGRLTKILLVIGPEGGFTEQEVIEAEAAGCVPVSLGRTILRTETAAMVALSCILYESGEMGWNE